MRGRVTLYKPSSLPARPVDLARWKKQATLVTVRMECLRHLPLESVNFPKIGLVAPQEYIARLFRNILPYLKSAEEVRLVFHAFKLAWEGHSGETRKVKGTPPYIIHPLGAAERAAKLGAGAILTASILLHDMIEDCEIEGVRVDKAFIRNYFAERGFPEEGQKIAFIVDGMTTLGKEPDALEESPSQADIFRKWFVKGLGDLRVILGKVVDRMDNAPTFHVLGREKARAKGEETLRIHVPQAGMLGIWPLKIELEDLSFKAFDPKKYKAYLEKMGRVGMESVDRVQKIKEQIEAHFAQLGIQARVGLEVRGVYELYQRMEEGEEVLSVKDVAPTDIWRFNIVVPNQETSLNCYHAYFAVHDIFHAVQGASRDFISESRPNRHRFLHTWVRVPGFGQVLVQVRNERMQEINERGILVEEDWATKGDLLVGPLVEHLRERVQLGDEEVSQVVAQESYRITVYDRDERPLNMRIGATPLDVAWMIDSDIFHHAVGVRINGRHEDLFQRLRDGDTVEILTNQRTRPKIEWVGHVRGKASTLLRNYLRDRSPGQIRRNALGILDQESKELHIPAAKLIKTALFRRYVSGFRFSILDKLEEELSEKKHVRKELRKAATEGDKPGLARLDAQIRKLRKKLTDKKVEELLRQLGSGELEAKKVFAGIKKLYFKELAAEKEEFRKLDQKIKALRESGKDSAKLAILEGEQRKWNAPYWISVELPLTSEEALRRSGILDRYIGAFNKVRFSLADFFTVREGDKIILVLAVDVLGGRRAGRIPGQIQRLMVRTLAGGTVKINGKSSNVRVINQRERIEAYLRQKTEGVHFA